MSHILGTDKVGCQYLFSQGYSPLMENDAMVHDPDKIRTLRIAKGWTKSRLAKEAGLSVPSIWALEKGETRMPKHDTMLRVALALGVPVADISADNVKESVAEAQTSQLMSIYRRLSQSNKTALTAAADAFLKAQDK